MIPNPDTFRDLSIEPDVRRLFDEQTKIDRRLRELRKLGEATASRCRAAHAEDIAAAAAAVRRGEKDPGAVRVAELDKDIEAQEWERHRLGRQRADIEAEFASLVRAASDLPRQIEAQVAAAESEAGAALDAFEAAQARIAMLRAVDRWRQAGGEADVQPHSPYVPGIVPNRGQAGSIPYRLDEVVAGLRRVNEPPVERPRREMSPESKAWAEQTRVALANGRI